MFINYSSNNNNNTIINIFSNKISKEITIKNTVHIRTVVNHLKKCISNGKWISYIKKSGRKENSERFKEMSFNYIKERQCFNCDKFYNIQKQLGKFNCSKYITIRDHDDTRIDCMHMDGNKTIVINRQPLPVSIIHYYLLSVNVPFYKSVEKIVFRPDNNGNIDIFNSFIYTYVVD